MSAEYDFYLAKGYGNIASESDFARLYREAACYLDKLTFGRSRVALAEENARDDVMNCMCAVAECLAEAEAEGAQVGVASENVDGYSVSFRSAEEAQFAQAAEIYRICRLYLPPEMLYRGV